MCLMNIPYLLMSSPHTFAHDQVGIRRSWAQVDRLDQVTENDEGNNVTGPSLFFVDRAAPTVAPGRVWR